MAEATFDQRTADMQEYRKKARKVAEFGQRWRKLYPRDEWTKSAAALMGIHYRTVTRWSYLETPIPGYAWLVLSLLEGLKANGGNPPDVHT